MSITIKKELDPIYEILNLIYMTHHDEWKEEVVKELYKYGLEGRSFFDKHYKIVEKYVKVFAKYKVNTSQEAYFFNEENEDFLLLILTFAAEYRKYMTEDTTPDVMELRSLLAYYMTDNDESYTLPDISDMPKLPDEKSMIEFLDTTDVKNSGKWYMLDFLRTPDQWLRKIFDMINVNIPAFEKAVAAVSKPLAVLMEKSAAYEDLDFIKIAGTYREDMVAYTSLVTPFIQVVLYSCGYQGILNEYLDTSSRNGDSSKEMLIRQIKCLADKSKLDILCELKKASMYNLELAEVLKLSPSTMSHHMGTLLSSGFVTVEKREGRVYYCVQEGVIRQFLAGLEQLIL